MGLTDEAVLLQPTPHQSPPCGGDSLPARGRLNSNIRLFVF